jgi:indolepyruvate ferredoxin oxidoreductase
MGINQGPIGLDQKYTQRSGHIFLTGIQALVRLPMAQIRRDRAEGLNTAAFVTGYRGSPLGGYDQQLMAAHKHLDQYGVKFQPGVNEDLASTGDLGHPAA